MQHMIEIVSVKTACSMVKTISNKQLESKIFEKIELLEKKVDTVLIRDLLAANAALDDIKAVGHASPEAIEHVRKLYVGNTGLPQDQMTYGIKNSQIVVASYLGLLQVGILQGEDEEMLCRYMLHMFATGEVVVFKELLNSFYQANYSRFCAHYEEEANRRKENWKSEKLLIGRYKLLAAATDVASGFIDPAPMPGTRLLDAIVRFSTANKSERCMKYVCSELDKERDRFIAGACAKKATEQLNKRQPFLLR